MRYQSLYSAVMGNSKLVYSIFNLYYFFLNLHSLHSSCFLSVSRRRDQTSQRVIRQAKKCAWGGQKTGEKSGGGELLLAVSFPSRAFLETPATRAAISIFTVRLTHR